MVYRIGGASARHGWRTILIWIVVLAIAGVGFAFGLGDLTNSFAIPSRASRTGTGRGVGGRLCKEPVMEY